MRLSIYTRRKRWDFDYKSATWNISDAWVYVETKTTTYIFPRENVSLIIITKDEKAEKVEERK